MEARPPILVLDDGELLRVERLLQQHALPFVRLSGAAIGPVVPRPSLLLVATGRRILEPPRFEPSSDGAQEPVRVCIHGQDFLPLRERLRELGVHFLVQGALDQQSLGMLLLQLVYRGPERREERRLPLGGIVHVRDGRAMLRARLVELSNTSCCFHTDRRFAPGSECMLVLPASLGGGDELTLSVTVRRCDADGAGWRVVSEIAELGERTRQQLAALTAGAHIGARVTPLAGVPTQQRAVPAEDPRARPAREATPAAADPAVERRRAPRVARRSRVIPVAGVADAASLVLTRDLSRSGASIVGLGEPRIGERLTLALCGAAREEPVVVEARVVRVDEEGATAVAFASLPESRARQIDRLCGGGRAGIESVDRVTGATRAVNVARVGRLPLDGR